MKGVWTALITPFDAQGELDLPALSENIKAQEKAKVDGILVLGTTGESPTLSLKEKEKVISQARKSSLPLMVGTGSYCTKTTIETTTLAKDLCADCALVVTPYYNKPTQEGIFRHFEAICTKTDLPIVIYNIQGRCGVNIEAETVARLAKLPNIAAIKEASGSIHQMMQIRAKAPELPLLCGDDALTLPALSIGATGVISVASNLVPELIKELVQTRSLDLHYRLLPLFQHLFLETNPTCIKWAMNEMGMKAGPLRLPLVELKKEYQPLLRQTLRSLYGSAKQCV